METFRVLPAAYSSEHTYDRRATKEKGYDRTFARGVSLC